MKYKLTENNKEINGVILYQIQALKDFGNVKEGDLGGWIEKEENLSQEGLCWIYDNAWVYGSAKVSGSASVCDNAWVCDNASVSGDARIYGSASVSGDARVYGRAHVWGHAKIYGYASVSGNARIYGNENIKKAENKVSDKKDILDNLNLLSDDIEEVVIKGIRYKKVTETKTFWKSVDISS